MNIEDLVTTEPFDVVVVGGGGSGATTAVAAAELGARVVVLEKMPSPGGNTEQSGGSLRAVSDREATVDYFFALAQGATPRSVIAAFVDSLTRVPDWLRAHGGELRADRRDGSGGARMIFPPTRPGAAFPELPGSGAVGGRFYLRPRDGRVGGAALWDLLEENLRRLEIPVVTSARVLRLVPRRDDRSIAGVEVATSEGVCFVGARRAVILCCGGFAYDEDLLVQFLGIALPSVGAPGRATGDGVRLAADVGADLWHMSAVSTSVGYRIPGFEAAFYCEVRGHGFVLVDQLGERYVNETALDNHSAVHAMIVQDAGSGRFLRSPSYLVFDEHTRRAGRLIRQPNGENAFYPWSEDNSAEVAKGWISEAPSIADLARSLDLPTAHLEHEIAEFNRAASSGRPDRFGRSSAEMAAIAGPPFYGLPVYPVILNTQGGPRRDEKGRILRPDGSPIRGLYGAGELGSVWSRLYPGTGNVSECVASALLAVRSIFEDVATSDVTDGDQAPTSAEDTPSASGDQQ